MENLTNPRKLPDSRVYLLDAILGITEKKNQVEFQIFDLFFKTKATTITL